MSKSTSAPKKEEKKKADVKRPEKSEIFQTVRKVFSKYVPPLSITKDTDTHLELVSKKEIEFMGKKRDTLYFGGVMVHKGFTGLYLMHIYIQKSKIEELGPELVKTLKGKSCFHLTHLDENILDQIDKAISNGIDYYRKMKFI